MPVRVLLSVVRRLRRQLLGSTTTNGVYVVPWINEGRLRTELVLNCWQEPYPRRKELEVSLTQYGQNGERVMQIRTIIPSAGKRVIPLEGRGPATYGICLIESNTCQQHVQISDGESFAITHGRGSRLHRFIGRGRRVRLGWWVDREYSKNFNALIQAGYGIELFLFNLSDVPGRVSVAVLGTDRLADLGRVSAFGALRIDPTASPLEVNAGFFAGTIQLRCTCPFDYYVFACQGPVGRRRYSFQHVK